MVSLEEDGGEKMGEDSKQKAVNLLIITGMSGAGKTTAVQSLEDLGFFCVDNLPPILIPKFAELIIQSGRGIERVALVIDLRGREFFDSLFDAIDGLSEREGIHFQILFLDANDQNLVRRYKETRRRHPLSPTGTPLEGIMAERRLLQDLKGRANQIIDTSQMKPMQLRDKIINQYSQQSSEWTLNVQSFGFKYGIPIDADLVFDVRFLPNPHYVDDLRPKTGCDSDVANYVMKWTDTQEFLARLIDFLNFTIPHYQREGKSQLVVGIGCTGGKHRSVAIAEHIGETFRKDYQVRVTHRDIEKNK
ncbi:MULTISPECIES: RNase adapter RapZ [Brevibacillus]|uniref:RNase adapter RapZ n=1 Tax=Brevibacillus laterosporus TaxID=1465 RepID=A0AAP3DL06_BRELA|nr:MULTISPECIES: RNase adapter RapZ [Brevibacillus]AYB40847.1 RNase adapter RapZ [Brevibacillus laterosporus]MBM7106661.1 glmZ(sRNA)-inactivating NTPase [Brevibacillus laterosporus]MCG7319636.1 RNase adapter RapZ [Brevibacillus laterosporus]MCR8982887.1 RNase adapter RapZ [Brevibacillus laterosporus]MCZ0810043.1 RNase adapter RapZ [Brevibacillus laterosporus]